MSPMAAALAALTRRQRTSAEILALLKRRGYLREECASVVARLEELGYVDDLAYAAAFAGTVARSKTWGPRRVRQELARRGVSVRAIEEGLAKAEEDGSAPSENIHAAAEKLIRRRGLPKTRHERDRMRAALARKGFEFAQINEVLDRAGAREPVDSEWGPESGDDGGGDEA